MDDQHKEYDSLRGYIDRQAILAFAQHRNALVGNPADRLTHLTAVGELAAMYAEVFYQDEDDFMLKRYRRQVCEAAGFLHEAMRQGCDYEAVLDVADEAVAGVVAAVTPDFRLPHPKRIKMLGNQIGLACADAQLVKLADLRHECAAKASQAEAGRRPGEVSAWLDEAREVLACLHKLKNTALEARATAVKREVASMEKLLRTSRRKT